MSFHNCLLYSLRYKHYIHISVKAKFEAVFNLGNTSSIYKQFDVYSFISAISAVSSLVCATGKFVSLYVAKLSFVMFSSRCVTWMLTGCSLGAKKTVLESIRKEEAALQMASPHSPPLHLLYVWLSLLVFLLSCSLGFR